MGRWSTRTFSAHEQMDEPAVDPRLLERALRFIRRINSLLGYTRATLQHLDRLTDEWHSQGSGGASSERRDRPLRILDVATGTADVPEAIVRWAAKRGINVEVVGLDLHAHTLAYAKQIANPIIGLVRGDALQLPFDDGAFDVVMTSMFLHHLPDDLAGRVLAEMARVASLGVIAADLERSPVALAWITLFTLFADPLVKHDARISVRQAFTMAEMDALAKRSGLGWARVHEHFAYRFVLAGRKPATAEAPAC
jgi:2-polyprenyl-3-methyl-5-hydroxy-6-metoxy-1,4-benzoquinol methylase